MGLTLNFLKRIWMFQTPFCGNKYCTSRGCSPHSKVFPAKLTSSWDICPNWVCSHRLWSPDTGHRMTGVLAELKPEISFSHTAAQQREWWECGASVVSPTFTRCVTTAGECWGVQNTHCPCGLFKPSHGFQDNPVSWEEWLFYHVLK